MDGLAASNDVVIRTFAPQEIIVSEGAPNDRFFVILDGSVEIYQNRKSIRILRESDVFGMENYYRRRPYTTSAVSITRSRIAAYHVETIREIIFERPQLTEQILGSVMHQLEQTTGVAEENILFDHQEMVKERIYQDGEVIIAENTDGKEMYRLLETQHGLMVTINNREIGTITRPGEYFGEMSALLHEKRSATVTSVGRSRIQVYDIDNMDLALNKYPDLAKTIIETLAKRLFDANKRLASGPVR